ncbi:MAG: nucleotidyltransferase family protein [Candidatus Woesearchaeota archaeon]
MKAIVLAAGYATRLYPLTLDRPKPLLPVAGKPMMEYIIDNLSNVAGINEVYIITNNKFYNVFVDWRKNFRSRLNIKILNDGTMSNDDRLGAVGDINFVVQKVGIKDEIMVVAGDNLFEFDLFSMEKYYRQKRASVVGIYDIMDKEKVAGKLGCVEVDSSQKIISFEEKPAQPKSTLISTAIYIFTREDVHEIDSCIRENGRPDNLGDFIKYLSLKKPVYGFLFHGSWYDIGTKELYAEANRVFEQKSVGKQQIVNLSNA